MDKYRMMAKEYGSNPSVRCRDCCNCQKVPSSPNSRYCIAFGWVEGYDCTWNTDKFGGCGLYNHPFKALRPRHVPLAEVYLKRKRQIRSLMWSSSNCSNPADRGGEKLYGISIRNFSGFHRPNWDTVRDCIIFGNPADWRSESVGAKAPSEEKFA